MPDDRDFDLLKIPGVEEMLASGYPEEHSIERSYEEWQQDPLGIMCAAVSEVNQTDPTAAAYRFVDGMVDRRDGYAHGGFLWHGWALREAFLAGVKWAREREAKEGS